MEVELTRLAKWLSNGIQDEIRNDSNKIISKILDTLEEEVLRIIHNRDRYKSPQEETQRILSMIRDLKERFHYENL